MGNARDLVRRRGTGGVTEAGEALSARLLAEAGDAWSRALTMRFVRDAIAGTLPDDVFARYLVVERQFVDTACRSLGAAILRAPSSAALSGFGRTLSSFLEEQGDYFAETMADTQGQVVAPRAQAQADSLSRRVLEICDRGSYAEIICCMLPSECLYEVWCGEAAAVDATRPATLQQWITSHAEPPYTETVRFLKSEVDRLSVSEEEIARLAQLVAEILDLERSFHDAAYITD